MEALTALPKLPAMAQWATFLRNHDELDLSRLTSEQRADTMTAFAPKPAMRIYDRGIRRRLAPMMRNDRRHIELAYSLQFSMPGHRQVLRYGEEIGMSENLQLPGRRVDPHPHAMGQHTWRRILHRTLERTAASRAPPADRTPRHG